MKIFFDVDGVLINNIHMVRGWIDRWDKDIEKDLGISQEKFQEIFKGWFLKVLTGHLDLEEEMEHWLKAHDYDLKAWQVIDYWHAKDTNINRPLYDIVDRLAGQGVPLYIATNQSRARAQYLWNEVGFKKHFRDIYYSARLGCLKQDPMYFRKIEEDLGLDPHKDSVLYFDDDPKNIAVAAARGWNACLYDTVDDVKNHPALSDLI